MSLPFVLENHAKPVSNVSAAPATTRVQGHVYDSLGSVVYNAQVDVKFMTTSTTWSGYTDANGFYMSRTFGITEWILDETIQVKATYGLEQATNTSLALNVPVQTVDVTMSLVIPEFGNSAGFLAAVGFSMLFVVVAVRWAVRPQGD